MKRLLLLTFFLLKVSSLVCMQDNLIGALQNTQRGLNDMLALLKKGPSKPVVNISWEEEMEAMFDADHFNKLVNTFEKSLLSSEGYETANSRLFSSDEAIQKKNTIISYFRDLVKAFDEFAESKKTPEDLVNHIIASAKTFEDNFSYWRKTFESMQLPLETPEANKAAYAFLSYISALCDKAYAIINKFYSTYKDYFSRTTLGTKGRQISVKTIFDGFMNEGWRTTLDHTDCSHNGFNCWLFNFMQQFKSGNAQPTGGKPTGKSAGGKTQGNIGQEVHAYFNKLPKVSDQFIDKKLYTLFMKLAQNSAGAMGDNLPKFGEKLNEFANFIANNKQKMNTPQVFNDLVDQFDIFFGPEHIDTIRNNLDALQGYIKQHRVAQSDKAAIEQWLNNFELYLNKFFDAVANFYKANKDLMGKIIWNTDEGEQTVQNLFFVNIYKILFNEAQAIKTATGNRSHYFDDLVYMVHIFWK